jgi:hypothetical protein
MFLKQKIVAFGLVLFSGACLANSLDQDLAKADTGRTASELIRLCTSADPDRLAYCEGYITGATHLWQRRFACESLAYDDKLFCAGAGDARTSIEETLSACRDCDQTEGRRKLRDELRAAGDICTPDERRDEHYCSGYNAEVEFIAAKLLPFRPIEAGESAMDAGLSHAVGDFVLHIWGSREIHKFVPCLQVEVRSEEVRTILLDFVRENPEQPRDTTAVIILAKALYYGLCPGPEQGLKPHMEQCTKWGYDNGQFGTKNVCDKAVFVQFQEKGEEVIEQQLNPGEALRTGRTRASRGWWMFATCPAAHHSSPALSQENNDAIRASRYSCVRK